MAKGSPSSGSSSVAGAEKPAIFEIKLSAIMVDPSIQPRDGVDRPTVAEYRRHLDELPPPVVFSLPDGGYILSDGRHRLEAHKAEGRTVIRCEVRPGGRAAAEEFAHRANLSHGKPLTREERTRAIKRLVELYHAAAPAATNAGIAEAVGVDEKTVRNHRPKPDSDQSESETRRNARGQSRPATYSNRGKTRTPADPAPDSSCPRPTTAAPAAPAAPEPPFEADTPTPVSQPDGQAATAEAPAPVTQAAEPAGPVRARVRADGEGDPLIADVDVEGLKVPNYLWQMTEFLRAAPSVNRRVLAACLVVFEATEEIRDNYVRRVQLAISPVKHLPHAPIREVLFAPTRLEEPSRWPRCEKCAGAGVVHPDTGLYREGSGDKVSCTACGGWGFRVHR